MTREDTPEFRRWSRTIFQMIADDGVWGVPRSGLIFRKAGPTKLTLIGRMPWSIDMPITARELRDYQDEEFEEIKFQFGLVGVEVDTEI